MNSIAPRVADSYRTGGKPKANPNNPVTYKRRKLYSIIKDRTAGDPQAELDYCMSIIRKETPKLKQYIISKNEVPADNIEDMINQAYQLRCREIDETAKTLGVSDNEANIFLEDDEAETDLANDAEQNNFVGELFAPVELAVEHMKQPDNLIDQNLITGIINTAGGKLSSAELKRAANNKPSGIIGFVTGGKQKYELLRAYLQKPENADEKDKIIKGVITDLSQLRGYANLQNAPAGGINVAANDIIDTIAKQKKREFINKNLPLIIIGVVVLIAATVYLTKYANRK